MKKSKEKKVLILSAIAVITLIAVVVGATYAFFTAQGGGSANTDVNVGTSTTDNLAFSFGDLININANETNFAEGMGSITDSTTGTAILKANNATNEANSRYNIYLIIENNDFEYTTEEGTPEILLNVTDPNGNKLENITGLVHYEDGFDITTRTGGFLIVPDYEISATDKETIQDWQVEVTLVNLDTDQNKNTNKTLTGKLYLTQEQMSSYELTEINNIETTTTYNSINATLDITNGSALVNKYYYGIEKVNKTRSATTVEYIETTNPNYEFTGLEANTEYTIYSYVEDENKIKSNIYETKVVTNEFNAPIIESVNHSVTLNSITLNVTATKGSNEIVKYMYSKDNGSTWEESTSNSHTFNNLKDTTEYKIKVKVIDSEGYESTEYYEAITTEIYVLPVVSSVKTTTTWNSITLTPSGTDGTNTISKYVYSINGGSYQESNAFNNLTDNTKYTIKVKAIDSANRESNEYTLEVTTDEYKLPTINNVTLESTKDSITIKVDATSGDGSIVSYHYSKDDGSNYTKSSNNSYTFNNLTSDTTFYIKVYVTDSNGRVSGFYASSVKTKSNTLANHIINSVYVEDGVNGLYYHDGNGTYGAQEAGDNSYRYAGANPNNFVCFGTDASTCPENNLYRIIGMFDDNVDGLYNIKLIKWTKYKSVVFDGEYRDSSNEWTAKVKPDIYTTLNETFYSEIPISWRNLIDQSQKWHVGGMERNVTSTSKEYYDMEIGTAQTGYEETMSIGLMYVSDYGYAASPENWQKALYDYSSAKNTDWLHLGTNEWTITRSSESDDRVFYIDDSVGSVDSDGRGSRYYAYKTNATRPTFYLNSTVEFSGGSGTQTDPFRISL